jgi:hypothetical protein
VAAHFIFFTFFNGREVVDAGVSDEDVCTAELSSALFLVA